MEKITSRENAKIKYACRLASSGAFRRSEGKFLAEGRKLCPELCRGAAAPAAVRSAPDPMSETERRVLACIGPKAKGVEELGAASGLPTGLLLGTLMKLELAGRVTCLPGKRYILR